MRERFEIRRGRHSPAFLSRIGNARIWAKPFRVPKGFIISNVSIKAKQNGPYVDLWEYLRSFGENWRNLLAPGQMDMKSKIGGLNWGLPAKTDNGNSWHPNSVRLAFDLFQELYEYEYRKGRHQEGVIEFHVYYFTRLPGFPRWLAYSLGAYIGGRATLPFDVLIEYDIEYHY